VAPLGRLLVVALATVLAAPAGASAHGDPTAHYLETDSLLTSYAAPPDVAVELQLRGVLDAAARRGYPIKVVLLSGDGDTGGELEPLEDTQGYANTVSQQLSEVRPLRAPVLIVTPDRYGVGGRQPPGGARALALPDGANGNALAQAAIVAVRRLSAAAGHALPERIPPARNNLTGILADHSAHDNGGPWLIGAVVAASALLVALLLVLHRRTLREPAKL
jgi:hypothetical protein